MALRSSLRAVAASGRLARNAVGVSADRRALAAVGTPAAQYLHPDPERAHFAGHTGDFFLHPEALIEELEETLMGQPLDEANLAAFIESFLSKRNATMLGVSPAHFAKCIVMAVEKDA